MNDQLLKLIVAQGTSALGGFVRAWLAAMALLCGGIGLLTGTMQLASGGSENAYMIGIFFAVMSFFWLAVPVAVALVVLFIAIKL